MDRIEQLEERVKTLLQESKNAEFTSYLYDMQKRIAQQRYQVDLLQDELDRRYSMHRYNSQLELTREGQEQTSPQNETVQQGHIDQQQMVQQGYNLQQQTVQQGYNYQQQTVQQGYNHQQQTIQQRYHQQQREASLRPDSVEYTIGGVLLSVLGGGFILIAFLLLGMNFMNGFAKGMCLYGAALLVCVISEVFLYRRVPKLGTVLTTLGLGCLYLSTVINYAALHTLHGFIAIGIVILITLFAFLLGRKRHIDWYRGVSIIACYLCLIPLSAASGEWGLWAVLLTVIVLSVLSIAQQPDRGMGGHHTWIHIMHMVINSFFMLILLWRADSYYASGITQIGIAIVSVAILHILLVAQFRALYMECENSGRPQTYGSLAAYCISAVLCGFMLALLMSNHEFSLQLQIAVIAFIAVICAIAFLLLRKYEVKWYIYYFLNLTLFLVYGLDDNMGLAVLAILGLLAMAKILSMCKIKQARVMDALLTLTASVAMLLLPEQPYGYILLGAVLLSIVFINHWQTYYEIVITFSVALFAATHLLVQFRLPAFVGIMFVAILAFHNVKRWHGKAITLFSGLALASQIICFLLLASPFYKNEYITYLCMLVFGLATIVITFQEEYHMNFPGKHMIAAIFLTYMALIIHTDMPVINSILMMLVALAGVGVGFARKMIALRLYGLVLSLCVCGKIVLYDYPGAPVIQKIYLFFIVGVIALIISGIYIMLEKKYNTSEGEMN